MEATSLPADGLICLCSCQCFLETVFITCQTLHSVFKCTTLVNVLHLSAVAAHEQPQTLQRLCAHTVCLTESP